MKDARNVWLMAGLLAGLVLGYIIAALSGSLTANCCTGLCTTGLPSVQRITKTAAKDAIKCYRKEPMKADTLKGFLVNLEQLHAMNKLFSDNPRLSGFRLYFGVIGDPVEVTIVCGVDHANDVTESNYVTFRRDSGPCPNLCDSDSEYENAGR